MTSLAIGKFCRLGSHSSVSLVRLPFLPDTFPVVLLLLSPASSVVEHDTLNLEVVSSSSSLGSLSAASGRVRTDASFTSFLDKISHLSETTVSLHRTA